MTDVSKPPLDATKARQGINTGRVRIILSVSLALAIAAMAAVLMFA